MPSPHQYDYLIRGFFLLPIFFLFFLGDYSLPLGEQKKVIIESSFDSALKKAKQYARRIGCSLKILNYWGEKNKKVIMFISRHDLVGSQIDELKNKFSSAIVLQLSGKIPNAESIHNLISILDAEYIVPILPLSIIKRLVEISKSEDYKFKVLFSEMREVGKYHTMPRYDPYSQAVVEARDENGRKIYKLYEFKRFCWLRNIILDMIPI